MLSSRLLGPDSGRVADCYFSGRFLSGRVGGSSLPPYDGLNLSWDVGDEPTAVAANRSRFAHSVGVEVVDLFGLRAAHGGEVAVVEPVALARRRDWARVSPASPQPGEWDFAGCDALVTRVGGIALMALSADCATVALADPDAGVVGVLHCGWRGLTAGIVTNTVTAMRELGATAIAAALGPAICGDCYRVDSGRAAVVAAVCPQAVPRRGDSIDVGAGVVAQLRSVGVQVATTAGCTAHDGSPMAPGGAASYFSYRRDGRTGRHATAVVLRASGVVGDSAGTGIGTRQNQLHG